MQKPQKLKHLCLGIQRLALVYSKGCHLVKLPEILYIESDGNHSWVHLEDSSKIFTTMPLKTLEHVLKDSHFYRIHNETIVNICKIVRYDREDGHQVILSNGKSLNVSRNRKDLFLNSLGIYKN